MRFISSALSIAVAVFTSACNDSERLDRLESEIRAIRSDTRDEIETLRDQVDASGAAQGPSALDSRVERLESRLVELLEKADDRGDMAYLRANANGHATMQTDHGPFLIRLEGIDLNVGGEGFTAHLEIGNPLSLSIQQFVLKGDFGSGVPSLAPGQQYSVYNRQIEEWQRTLSPFEVRVTKPLQPMTWTPVDVLLDARSRDELELIRFSMIVENAHLEGITSNSSTTNDFAHLSVDSESASVLRTDYGAFLIVVKRAERAGVGTRLDIEIGNPYGFTINQCRLVGDFGSPIPKRGVGEPQAQFLGKLQEWTAGLKPFNSQITSKLSSFRWNTASILVPGPPEEVKFLRARLRIENVTLPQATD